MAQANLVAPQLTNTEVWFATPASFNTFMSSCYVNITADKLPIASVVAYGAVKEATTPAFNPVPFTPTYNQFNVDGVALICPDQTSFVNLYNKVVAVEAALNALRTAMGVAGQLVET